MLSEKKKKKKSEARCQNFGNATENYLFDGFK